MSVPKVIDIIKLFLYDLFWTVIQIASIMWTQAIDIVYISCIEYHRKMKCRSVENIEKTPVHDKIRLSNTKPLKDDKCFLLHCTMNTKRDHNMVQPPDQHTRYFIRKNRGKQNNNLIKELHASETSSSFPPRYDVVVYPVSNSESKNTSSSLECEDNMEDEQKRFLSFSSCTEFSHNFRVLLAHSGFFYIRHGRQGIKTKCFACRCRCNRWSPMDDPDNIHRIMSPRCPFLQQLHEQRIQELSTEAPNLHRSDAGNANGLPDMSHASEEEVGAVGGAIGPEAQHNAENIISNDRFHGDRNNLSLPIMESELESSSNLVPSGLHLNWRVQMFVYDSYEMQFIDLHPEIENIAEQATHDPLHAEFDVLAGVDLQTMIELREELLQVSDHAPMAQHPFDGGTDLTGEAFERPISRNIREQMICISCKECFVEVRFIPCHHLVCCRKCGDREKYCPRCKCSILEKEILD